MPFLRQCIKSIIDACKGHQYEIIIVDNDSTDGSAIYLSDLQEEQINVILNKDNTGYSKAMNQGIHIARGKYLLLLNPDTIITQKAVTCCIDQLKTDQKCGAVGVRMIDGNGKFLKESKRGYPTALSAFYKISGLSRLFPTSQLFANYHQGHLDSRRNHKIEILTGAFFMTRRALIEELGGFDEQYFMYGEDIDLSFSITEAGYYNYYIGEESIIHFKGESTRKDSLKNTYHFYNSMLLFTKKYSAGNGIHIGLLSLVLTMIGLARWIKLNLMPVIGSVLRFGVYWLIYYIVSILWAKLYFGDVGYFAYQRHAFLIFGYAFILTLGYYIGNHHKFQRVKNLVWATLAILVVYSLLPLPLRSSRAVIILGSAAIVGLEIMNQLWRSWRQRGTMAFWTLKRNALLLGSYNESIGSFHILQSQRSFDYKGIISDEIINDAICLTNFDHLENYLAEHEIDTMTMHMESMSMGQILRIISKYGPNYQYLLYSSKTNSIIDSPDSNTQGTVSLVEISWAIASPTNRKVKRAIDILASLVFLASSPVLIWFVNNKTGWISNIYQSIIGKTSWVGYSNEDKNLDELPKLRPAVVSLPHAPGEGHFENVAYARDYTFIKDIRTIMNSFTALGNEVNFNGKN